MRTTRHGVTEMLISMVEGVLIIAIREQIATIFCDGEAETYVTPSSLMSSASLRAGCDDLSREHETYLNALYPDITASLVTQLRY
jgi:hypothetical protein